MIKVQNRYQTIQKAIEVAKQRDRVQEESDKKRRDRNSIIAVVVVFFVLKNWIYPYYLYASASSTTNSDQDSLIDVSETTNELDQTLPTLYYEDFIKDEVRILTDQQKDQIALYNANWDERYGSLVPVVTTLTISGEISEYSYTLDNDGILVLNIEDKVWHFESGPNYGINDDLIATYMDEFFDGAHIDEKQYAAEILNFFDKLNQGFWENYDLGYLTEDREKS